MAKTNGTNGHAVATSGGYDLAKLRRGAANSKKAASASGGARAAFLRMDKDRQGQWSYGVDDTDIGPDEVLYVDPEGHVYGWQCWADTDQGQPAANLGTVVAPTSEPLPPKPDVVPEGGRPWGLMRGMSLVLNGQPLTYTTTALGGLAAVEAFTSQWDAHVDEDPQRLIAGVKLRSESYKNKRFGGRTYVPIFDIVKWVATLPKEAVTPAARKAVAPPVKAKAPLARAARR